MGELIQQRALVRQHKTNRRLGANTLLAYFHYCNKATYPFSAECKDQDLQTLAELDNEAIKFVHDTRQLAATHSEYLDARTAWERPPLTRQCCRKGMGGPVAP